MLGCSLVDCERQPLQVFLCERRDVKPSVLIDVDVFLSLEKFALLTGQPGETEHAGLLGHVTPGPGLTAEVLQAGTELAAHVSADKWDINRRTILRVEKRLDLLTLYT